MEGLAQTSSRTIHGTTRNMKITDIKLNPHNPRVIKDAKFKKLVQSIKEFPEMLNLRPIVINPDGVVLGGNMRLRACMEAGIEDVPVQVAHLTPEQEKEFIIKDNVGFGEWDWNQLANEWEVEMLDHWGLDLPLEFGSSEPIDKEPTRNPIMKITFDTPEQLQEAEIEFKEIIDRKYTGAFYTINLG